MRNRVLSKKPGLSYFTGITKAYIIIREYIRTVIPGHKIKPLRTPLRKNDSVSFKNGRKIRRPWFPSGADDVAICTEQRVERQNHGVRPKIPIESLRGAIVYNILLLK